MSQIDLNCDMGESFSVYRLGNDTAVLEHVTSANVACGFHAGDPTVMRETVALALEKGVALGAHPGFPDLLGFGRRAIDVSPQEAYDLVVYQVGALHAFVTAAGARMQHVKPHGALYNVAAVKREIAEAIAQAVGDVGGDLVLFGLSGSELVAAGERIGLRTASEVFADRTYQSDGTLTSRREPGALITDDEQALAQALRMATEGKVRSLQGEDVRIRAETICIHGDNPKAAAFARDIRRRLEAAGIEVKAVRAS